MKKILSAFLILTNTLLLQAQDQTKYYYDFSDDEGISTYSNKNWNSKIKDGMYKLSTSGNFSRNDFTLNTQADNFKRLEVSAEFTPGKLNETSRYGFSSGYKGYKKYVYGDSFGGNYYHMLFEIDKLKGTFSVYDFTITGDNYFYNGVPNYYVKDKAAPEINTEGSDVLAIRRDNNAWDFSINNKIVYTRPDTSTQYSLSTGILVTGKAEVNVDNMKYNYEPEYDSKLFIAPDLVIPFADSKFKAALITAGADLNGDGEIQKNAEASEVREMNVYSQGLTSLEGIEHFEYLTELNCYDNQLTALDVSKNTRLKKLFCKENKLTALDLSKNSGLEEIACSSNELTSLNISGIRYLRTLVAASNKLTALDVSGQKNLSWLDCRWNLLTVLNVSESTSLKTLLCENNSISKIIASPEQQKEEWTKDAAAQYVVKSVFKGCNGFNIVKDADHRECLKTYEDDKFTYQYHPLWKESKMHGVTSVMFDIQQDDMAEDMWPLKDKYTVVIFEASVNRYYSKPFAPLLANIKTNNDAPKEFDFTHSSGKKGKIITFNYVHEGTGISRYDVFVLIPTDVADSPLYSMMRFSAYPKSDINGGIAPADEAAFREYATGYFNNLRAK